VGLFGLFSAHFRPFGGNFLQELDKHPAPGGHRPGPVGLPVPAHQPPGGPREGHQQRRPGNTLISGAGNIHLNPLKEFFSYYDSGVEIATSLLPAADIA
jgi:hypothetical protein